MLIRFIVIFGFLSVFPLITNAQSIDLLLKARGLQGVENIKSLIKDKKKPYVKSFTPQEKCQWTLENAYTNFATSDTFVVKNNHMISYVLQMVAMDKGIEPAKLIFVYDSKTNELMDLRAVASEPWSFSITPLINGSAFLRNPKCQYRLKLYSPIDISVFKP